jgi:hypothetical protein
MMFQRVFESIQFVFTPEILINMLGRQLFGHGSFYGADHLETTT